MGMTGFGHAAFAMAFSEASGYRKPERIACVLGAIYPDWSRIFYFMARARGIDDIFLMRPWWTHGLLGLVFATAAAGLGYLLITRRMPPTGLVAAFALGIFSHLVLDSFIFGYFGTRWLGPFVPEPYSVLGFETPLIRSGGPADLIITVLLFAVYYGLRWFRRRHRRQQTTGGEIR
jgi:membrane-bound metal-dependent hydrolase YbcI (DUF457 family)